MRSSLLFQGALCFSVVTSQLDTQIPITTFRTNTTGICHDACTALRIALPSLVKYNTTGHLPLSLFDGYYTLAQRETIPLCILLPSTAIEVSTAIKIISEHACHFAVKSGGHAMFPGASSALDGIVIDMLHFNQMTLSEDGTTAYVGTGQRWGAVYEWLEPWNLTVVGGRVGDVGVGGFLLGGGISYISRSHGWGCDNVRSYEIVLANGTITNITYISHPDLFFALRGGGSNFGIVTSFALETHPLISHWWGGFDFFLLDAASHPPRPLLPTKFSFSSISTLSSLKDQAFHLLNRLGCLLGYCVDLDVFAGGLEKLVSHMADDELMTGYGTIAMLPGMGGTYGVGMNSMHYGGGEGLDAGKVGKETEKAYLVVKKALGARTIHSSLRRDSAMGFVRELDGWNPVGVRMTYHTATFRPNAILMAAIIRIFFSEAETIRHLPDVQPAMSMQTISVDELRHFGRNGGNAVGIKEEDGPLIILLASFGWGRLSDTEAVLQAAQNVIDRSVVLAKEMGFWHPFIYQNYAARGQDVFDGYEKGNLEKLRRVQRSVDPRGVFGRLSPGGFKV